MSGHATERNFHTTTSAYSLPNDEREHVRLERQSAGIVAMLGGHPFLTTFAPAQPPLRAIDIGCGTGVVASHIADHFPSAEVIGLDLSPVPSTLRQKPANLRFVQGDIMASDHAAPLERATFDFVFSRMLVAGIPDWPTYIRKCHSLLKPGGLLESQEITFRWHRSDEHGNETEISSDWDWLNTIRRSAKAKSIDLLAGEELAKNFAEAGFVDVTVSKYKWMWSIDSVKNYPECTAIGQYSVEHLKAAFFVMMTRLCAKELHEAMEKDVETTLGQLGHGEWQDYWVVRGRKPA